MTPEAYPRDGGAGEGVHPRRRHLPGGAVAALQPCPSSCRPSRSTGRCAGSTPRPSCSISTSAAIAHRRLQPGDPGAAARRQGHHPPDRRHAAARRDAGGGRGAGRRPAGRPEGAGRAPDAARPRPQRCRPRREDRQRHGHRADGDRVLLPRHAHRLERRRARSIRSTTRWTR